MCVSVVNTLLDVQDAASHADPRTTMRFARAGPGMLEATFRCRLRPAKGVVGRPGERASQPQR